MAAPTSAWAQRTTGDIRGVITDESGAVLPGVTVTLRGPGGARHAHDRVERVGRLPLPNLAPGIYEISVELAGFATKTQTGIPVELGATQEVPVQMNVSTQQETIPVVAETPVVDAATTELSTNYNREWVENAPVRRFTFFDPINAAPGVAQQSPTVFPINAFGSAANENLYLLDGTDFTAPLSGAAWPWPNTDAIEEVQSLSLGASAEYGNVAGAVFNIVTRQGSNQFHGDTNFYWQSDDLTGRNTDDDEDGGQPITAPASSTAPRSSADPSSRTSCGSSARGSSSRTGSRSPGPTRNSRLSRTRSVISSNSTTRSTRTIACSSSSTTTTTRFPSAPPPTRRRAPST